MSLLPICCPHKAAALFPQDGRGAPFLQCAAAFLAHSCLSGYLGSFFTIACATSGTFVQSAVIQSGLKISGKTLTGLYDLWGSACLHLALKFTSSIWCIYFNLQPWLCLSVPCAATGREIRGECVACIKMSGSWKTPRYVEDRGCGTGSCGITLHCSCY